MSPNKGSLRPEEQIRQALVHHMVGAMGYPESLVAVECSLDKMAHLQGQEVPTRRADIVCFAQAIHPDYELYPLLMIECKAVPLNDAVVNQVVGYNTYVGAYFIAVANAEEVRTGWLEEGKYTFMPGLPTYSELLATVQAG